MKKEYEKPEVEIVSFSLPGVLYEDVLHSSFEQGGNNSGWTYNDSGDDEFWDLP